MELSFTSAAITAAVAFAAPLVLGLAPGFQLPAVVLELVFGILIGPSVLDWVHVDPPVEVLSLLGLAFLLLLAGLEVEFAMLRRSRLRIAALVKDSSMRHSPPRHVVVTSSGARAGALKRALARPDCGCGPDYPDPVLECPKTRLRVGSLDGWSKAGST